MDQRVQAFLENNHSAAMITLRRDGTPHAVRVGVAVVDGKLWSSQARLRTGHLRRDPRASLFVFDDKWSYLGLDCTVTILAGADAPDLNMRLFEVMQAGMTPKPAPGKFIWYGQEKGAEEFRQLMIDEGRLIYQFEIKHSYGLY